MTLKFSCLASAALLVISAVPASAAPFLFTLTGSRNAVFQIDSGRSPDTSSSSFVGSQIGFGNVSGTFGGTSGVASNISFGTGPILADLNINGTPLGFTQFSGPNLFTGPVTAPVFTIGTFNLSSIVSGASTLNISSVVAAVPEPGTWAMLLLGVGAVGFAMRRRNMRTTASYA